MEKPLTLTKYWLEKIVMGLDLCPFAKIPYERGLIRTVECNESSLEGQMGFFLSELEFLHENPEGKVATTLIVYPNGAKDFIEFHDFVGDLEFLLEEAHLAHTFQLVAFHPKFIFENTEFSDLGNLVNRSPYPVLHILRSSDLDKAIKSTTDGEVISFTNDKKLRSLSKEVIDELFYYLKK